MCFLCRLAAQQMSENIFVTHSQLILLSCLFTFIPVGCSNYFVLVFCGFAIPGERTFGVLTKIDLMDQGTDAVDVSSSFNLWRMTVEPQATCYFS